MSILGTYIDRLSGRTLTGVTLTTAPHSLPGTNPELMAAQLRSSETATAPGDLLMVGGNASILTIGLNAASVSLGSNMDYFDVYSFVFFGEIR